MNPEFIAFILVALYVLASLAVLFLGARLVRHDLNWSETEDGKPLRRRSRLIEDLRPLQDTVVGFVAHSAYAPQILATLAGKNVPLPLNNVAQEVRLTSKRPHTSDDLPAPAWAAIFLMRVAGLIRLGRRGIVLTDIGREIEQRIRDNSARSSAEEKLRNSRVRITSRALLPGSLPLDTSAKSHLRLVRQALRREPHCAFRAAKPRTGRTPDRRTAEDATTRMAQQFS